MVASLARLDEVLYRLRYSLILAALLIPLVIGLIVFLTAQHYLSPIRLLSERMREVSVSRDGDNSWDISSALPDGSIGQTIETKYFAESVAILAATIEQSNRLRARLQVSQSTAQLAKQVAHDIRSPAAALSYALSDPEAIDGDRRLMMKKALERIQDIANSLLSLNESEGSLETLSDRGVPSADSVSKLPLAVILTQIVREKRSQNGNGRVDIELELPANRGYGLHVEGVRKDLLSVFSNVLNNAIEALEECRKVHCELNLVAGRLVVKVRDEGKGIPPAILPKIFSRGFTHGKAAGNGLGLFHARSVIESMGGNIVALSEVGKGTTVVMTFPLAERPPWFVSELRIVGGTNVIICDDDPSIHALWQNRLQGAGIGNFDAQVINFYDLPSLKSWYENQYLRKRDGACLFLMDHDFQGDSQSGVDVLRALELGWQSIVVSSYLTEMTTAQYIENGQIGLIIKSDLADVPISLVKEQRPEQLILVEDNVFVREAWQLEAKKQGLSIRMVTHPRELLTSWHIYPRDTPIFIDSELEDAMKGERLAEFLHEIGFQKLFITTGHDPKDFHRYEFLSGVLGKEPPAFVDGLGDI